MHRITLWVVLTFSFIKGIVPNDAPCQGGVAELNTDYELTADRRNFTVFVWVQPTDERHVATCNLTCSAVAGYRATINDTHTTLTLDSVGRNDSGTWKIFDANDSAVVIDVCHLVTANPPQCNVSSDVDTDALELGTEVTLAVDIRGYYCSGGTVLGLVTGNITDVLLQNHTTGDLTDAAPKITFNITSDRLGEVKVKYECDTRNWMLSCGGIQSLNAAISTTVVTSTAATSPTNDTLTSTAASPSTTTETLTSAEASSAAAATTTTTTTTTTSTGASPTDSTCIGGVGLLGAEYQMVGDRSNFTGVVWVRPTDGRYVVTCSPHCSPVAGYSATLNDTHSTLTIDSVGEADAGTWKIVDATVVNPIPVDVCHLTAAELPQCSISSDEDTDSLEPGAQLTLTVDITDYYCSVETGFDLTTGAVTEELVAKHNVTGVSTKTVNQTFNVDVTRLGDVMINFQCSRSWTLTCNGVQKMLKSPPLCNISSDTDTNALHLGTYLTLMVDLRNYYCQYHAGFGITTGSISDVLLQNQTTNNITNTALTTSFNVTADHLGDVSVAFMCDGVNKALECGGVGNLTETTSTSTSTLPTTSHTTSHTTSEEPKMTSDEPSTTARSYSTGDAGLSSDLTVGLSVGLSLCVVLFIVFVAFKIYNGRLTKEKQNRYMPDTNEDRGVDLKGMTNMHENENYVPYVASTEVKNNNP
ncbi:mucin-5AC-like isoform X2 [Haliotis rufescens]|uniref:mucin-5AC-like isoform X2 n=1 Tax=Haliotis rufescens TaxID=6454 RepID=UPI00201EB885|nr:mucin-5AC-like isoform X2 [Haliotis rufescens]